MGEDIIERLRVLDQRRAVLVLTRREVGMLLALRPLMTIWGLPSELVL